MKIQICIPSYRRAGNVTTLGVVSNGLLLIDKIDEPEYLKFYPKENIYVVPDGIQGNFCRVLNYMLDTFMPENDVVVRMDDDIQYLGYLEGGKLIKMDFDSIMVFLEKYSLLCEDWGFKMWGVGLNFDPQNYDIYSPFFTKTYIGGPFNAHLKHDLRYDESLPSKDDYDMTIKQCNKYRGCLRVNKFFYVCKQAENVGGLSIGRNVENEIEANKRLQKKWGKNIVKFEKLDNDRSHKSNKKKNFDINPILHIPIKGI